jgi:hypothetical protein
VIDKSITDDTLDQLDYALRMEAEKRQHTDPAAWFPWHRIQSWLLEAPELTGGKPTRVMLVAGGNRGGKSKIGMGIYSQLIRRTSPLNKQLITQDKVSGRLRPKGPKDPLTIWVIPPTLEKARQDWLQPSDQMGLRYWAGNRFVEHKASPDNVVYTSPPGLELKDYQTQSGSYLYHKLDKAILKSQDQKILSFEASAVDVAIFDEEVQDEKKWNSVMLRLATNNGVVIMCYTPLHGLSWSYSRYWQPLVEAGRAQLMGERCWIHSPKKGSVVVCAQFGSGDNPMAKIYAEEIESDPGMSDAEKAARLYGQYGYVEGSLIPQLSGLDVISPRPDHAPYVVDYLPGQMGKDGRKVPGAIHQWILAADPNKSYGAVLGCLDTDDNLYIVAEHLESNWPDRMHVAAFKKLEKRFVTGPIRRVADPGSAGAHSITNMADLGMYFDTMKKGPGSVPEGVKQMRGLAWVDPNHVHPITGEKGAPRIYFYRPGVVSRWEENGTTYTGCRTAQQISMARQTDNPDAPADTPHKSSRSKLDLFDCVRYMVKVASQVPPPKGLGRQDLPTPTNILSVKDTQLEEAIRLAQIEHHANDPGEYFDFSSPDYNF